MSKYVSLIFLLFISQVNALPCSTTGGITYRGDTIEQVFKQCGDPYDKKSYTKNAIKTQRIVYFKDYFGRLVKLSILLNNNRVVNMTLEKKNVLWTKVCGGNINVGNPAQTVLSVCGVPAYTKNLVETNVQITEMRYSTSSPQTWVFENGTLMGWK